LTTGAEGTEGTTAEGTEGTEGEALILNLRLGLDMAVVTTAFSGNSGQFFSIKL